MIELEAALVRILAALPPPAPETVPLSEAAGRILLEPVLSPIDLPAFDNSAMDGYAVRAADLAGARPESPVCLRVVAKVPAGQAPAGAAVPGACVRLFTGSPLPPGADAVVMQEETQTDPDAPDSVRVLNPVVLGENVRFRGEDVRRGARLGDEGCPITAGWLSLLAAAGTASLRVGRRPRVGLLATGSELREPSEAPASPALAPRQIYESNRLALAALARRAGGVATVFPLVPDDFEATRRALAEAFAQCDVVVTTGGVSVGEMDLVRRAFEESGGRLEFWKVAIKPGRPFVFGRWMNAPGRFLFGLPGNPVSALVTFLLLVRPALLRWQGACDLSLPSQPGVLAESLANPDRRRHFLRVHLDAAGKVVSAGAQASHILSSFAAANGLVDLAPQTTLPAGATVPVLRWDDCRHSPAQRGLS